jgi:hypothetical protein
MLFTENSLNGFKMGDMHPYVIMTFLYKLGADLVDAYMNHKGVKSFLEEDQNFDVCIFEVFNADAFLVSFQNYSVLNMFWSFI